MSSPVVHQLAVVHCQHGGHAQPVQVSSRVLVEGKPVVLLDAPWTVQGCALPAPDTCTSARFVSSSTRVHVTGRPVVLADSASISIPNGATVAVMTTQQRVVAS
ncbi:MAG: hypothetical protein H0X22_05010 [Acidimicrobiia bacterium]|nr:hypothetical protein [Nocardioidaceae bacterium]MBA3802250.1 hypothetical protein [Acidimicrobiia bacterium]